MRVGLICPYSLTVPGGVQNQVMAMARELRRRGHEARVLGPCDGPPPAAFVTPLGNSLPTAANGSIAPLAPDPPAMFRTLQALSAERFEVLHLHEPMVPGPTLTAVVTARYPTVGTFHAAGRSASYRLIKPLLTSWVERIDHRVVVSKDALELVRSHLGGEYEVLFNGVELSQIRSVEPLGRPAGAPPAIFFCGRHEERKGLEVLIDAVDRLDVEVELWIASDGPDTVRLQRRTAGDERTSWLGRISDEEKFARLRAASVFCAPSLGGESFGVVLIEAMAAGTTVVASALQGYRNVATDGVDALLSEPGDPDALASALRRALTHPERAAQLRAAGARRAEAFSMASLVDRYEQIYRSLLER
ncbi:glycosyltransferase family 4 protein [Ilumatobacter sp.]|uniref:glycosyltransferase family 4 protein n=1 Tax=Ilumatobacter sp. TaxID=1967498 RepID=UPI003B52EA19